VQSLPVLLEFVPADHGTFQYKAPEQARVAESVLRLTGWALLEFDLWLYRADSWKGYPSVRQKLMSLRQDMVILLNQAQHPSASLDDQLCNAVVALQCAAHACKRLPADLKIQLRFSIAYRQTPYQSKLTPSQIRRLKVLWEEMVRNGQRYGALKRLAVHFGISSGTVKKILEMPEAGEGS
jgi:hypothetical protein